MRTTIQRSFGTDRQLPEWYSIHYLSPLIIHRVSGGAGTHPSWQRSEGGVQDKLITYVSLSKFKISQSSDKIWFQTYQMTNDLSSSSVTLMHFIIFWADFLSQAHSITLCKSLLYITYFSCLKKPIVRSISTRTHTQIDPLTSTESFSIFQQKS